MEIISVSETDLEEIEGDRHRTFCAASTPLTAEVILNDIQRARRKRVIVICNTVSKSQALFRDLVALDRDEALKITLLHARFLTEHRAEKEKRIQQREFAENWEDDGQCYVLIATQVIEAGINITCEVMHTELSPMNSLLQRAGRCARFKEERGEVYVYWNIQVEGDNVELASRDFEPETETESAEKKSFVPYARELCELTWQVLQEHTASERVNQQIGFSIEQEWIDRVHRQEDSLHAQRRQNDRAEFDRRFHDAVFSGKNSHADELIRFVDSRSVFVWEPQILIDFEDDQIDPKKLLPFSVPTTTLCKVWREVQNLEYEIDWMFKRIQTPKDKDAETYSQPACIPIRSRNDLVSSIQILVNPRYVHYDDEIGLLIGVDVVGNWFASPDKPQKQAPGEYRYRMDTYVGHLGCMWKCWREPFLTIALNNGVWVETQYASVRDELLPAGGRLLCSRIFPKFAEIEAEALFEYLVLLAVFTHDLGKLQLKWQEVMRGWQSNAHSSFKGRHPKSHLLAHTDYNPDKQQRDALKAYETTHKRPNHAVESAFLAQYILHQCLVPLLRDYFHATEEQIFGVVYTVILAAGRHHSAWAKGWGMKDIRKVGDIKLHPDAQKAIASSWRSLTHFVPQTLPLPEAPPNLSQTLYKIGELDLNKFSSAQIDYLQLYSLVVRALRLCDSRSVRTA